MTYHIKQTPKATTTKEIYASDGGRGYAENDELHLTSPQVHYIYKFAGTPVGWYMRNDVTGVDYYLSAGASPTLNLHDLNVLDAEYWAEITYTPEADTDGGLQGGG